MCLDYMKLGMKIAHGAFSNNVPHLLIFIYTHSRENDCVLLLPENQTQHYYLVRIRSLTMFLGQILTPGAKLYLS